MNLLERIEHELQAAEQELKATRAADKFRSAELVATIRAYKRLLTEFKPVSTEAPDIDTQEAIAAIGRAAIEGAKAHGINVKEDEFTAVQPYTDTQAILFRVVDDEDGRSMKVDVRDAVFILPRINKHLDIYNREEKE